MTAKIGWEQGDNWSDLQRGMALRAGAIFLAAAMYAWSREVSVPREDGRLVLLALVCACLCLAAPLTGSRLPGWLLAAVPVAASFAAAWLAWAWLGYAQALALFVVPVALGSYFFGPLAGLLLTAAATSIVTRAMGAAVEWLWAVRLLILTVGLLSAALTQSYRQALGRAWLYADQWASLAREVRARQEEVNRLNKALTVSNGLLKRSFAELANAQTEAEAARHLKEQFATTVSHELRTPLSIILGFVQVMQQYPEVYGDVQWTPALRRDLSEIQRSARYLSSLVDDILDLARIQALKMPIHRERTDLVGLAGEVVELASRLLMDKPGVRMIFEAPRAFAPILHIDHVRVRQVLLNLLANACRFTGEGEIRVELRPGHEEVVVAVSDTGPGIPPEQLETIFEEFRQGTSPELDDLRGAGKGLGLAIARHFVQMHGGRIWAESRSDPAQGQTGSSFFFSLPLTEKQVVRLGPLSAPGKQPVALPSVVVVDDGEGQRLLARHLDGYEVLAAPDLATARRIVRQSHPQAVIVNVPPEAQDATQARPPAILPEPVPVLQCSLPVGRWFMEPELFDDWLVKPIDIERLAAAVSRQPRLQRILVVDDDRAFVRLLRRALAARFPGCEVVAAHDAEEAQARLAQGPVQVALVDIGLPGVDGRTLARGLREGDGHDALSVIAVTGIQPGLEGAAASPHSFAVTSCRGFGEEDTLALIRACLGLLRPGYALDAPPPATQAAPDGRLAW